MAKGKKGYQPRRPGMGGMGGGGMGNLMGQVQKLQEEMAKAQAELENEEITVTAGGGMVTVVATGDQKDQEHRSLKREVVDPDDVEMLQDLVLAAVNDAIRQVEALPGRAHGRPNRRAGPAARPGAVGFNSAETENVCNHLPNLSAN